MAERTTEQPSESEADEDTPLDIGISTAGDGSDTDDAGGYFSLRALIVSVVAIGACMTLGGLVPIIPYTGLLGIPLGAFLHGLFDSHRRYIETAIAGGVLSGVAVVSSLLPQLIAGLNGARLFAVSAGIGIVVAVLGHYFGRDLRAGLQREL